MLGGARFARIARDRVCARHRSELVQFRHLFSRPLRAGAALAFLALLLFAAPSAVRPPAALAQSYGCGTGQTYGSVYGQSCYSSPYSSPYGGSYGGCTYGSTYGCSSYGTGYGCGSSQYYSCTGNSGCSGLFGAGCSGVGAGGCAGIALQAGQSCSSGVVTCAVTGGASVPCGGGATGIQHCPPNVITPICTGAAATTAAPVPALRPSLPSSQNMTCPGGGYVSVGQSCSSLSQVGSAGVSTAGGSGIPGFAPPQFGFQVSLAPGWNLIAGPAGTMLGGVSGSVFTFQVGSSRVDLQACKLEYSIVSPK